MVEGPRVYHVHDFEAGGGRSLHDQSPGEAFLALVLRLTEN